MNEEQHLTAWEFLRELVQTQTRAQLTVTALVGAFTALAAIVAGLSIASGWPGVAAAAGLVALVLGAEWWALGIERVQRWIWTGE